MYNLFALISNEILFKLFLSSKNGRFIFFVLCALFLMKIISDPETIILLVLSIAL